MSTAARPAATASVRASTVGLSRRRRAAVWVLVVAASLIGFVSILTVWVNRQMLDNGAWTTASAKVIQDPKVRSALSVYLVNQLYDRGNVAAQLQQQLPPTLKPLAGPISGALRQPAVQGVEFMLSRPRIQQLWINANQVAHQRLVNVLENKTGFGIATGNGVVTLDLSQLIKQLGQSLGLPAAALAKLPANTGKITIMRSDQLSAAQQGVQAIRVLSVWLVILVLALYALAIYLARGIRRETLRNIGWAFVIVGVLDLVVRRIVGNYVIDGLTAPAYRATFHDVFLIMSSILGDIGRSTILYGIVLIVGAVLAGPTRAAIAVRRWAAPVLNTRPGTVWSGAAFVYLLLILWGPTHALRTWWGILFFGGLLALGIVVLRRQTQREFPDAGLVHADGGGVMHHMRGLFARKGTEHNGGGSPAEEIARLQQLRTTGAITDEEFARAKQLALS
jgi:hypothetical protein